MASARVDLTRESACLALAALLKVDFKQEAAQNWP